MLTARFHSVCRNGHGARIPVYFTKARRLSLAPPKSVQDDVFKDGLVCWPQFVSIAFRQSSGCIRHKALPSGDSSAHDSRPKQRECCRHGIALTIVQRYRRNQHSA